MKLFSRAAVAATAVALTCALAPAAMANDSVNVVDNATPTRVTAFPTGSSLVGPVNARIDTLVLDAGNVTAILRDVALLAGVYGPINT